MYTYAVHVRVSLDIPSHSGHLWQFGHRNPDQAVSAHDNWGYFGLLASTLSSRINPNLSRFERKFKHVAKYVTHHRAHLRKVRQSTSSVRRSVHPSQDHLRPRPPRTLLYTLKCCHVHLLSSRPRRPAQVQRIARNCAFHSRNSGKRSPRTPDSGRQPRLRCQDLQTQELRSSRISENLRIKITLLGVSIPASEASIRAVRNAESPERQCTATTPSGNPRRSDVSVIPGVTTLRYVTMS